MNKLFFDIEAVAILLLFLSALSACNLSSETINQTTLEPTPTTLPTPSPTLDFTTSPKSPLSDFPLNIGNTWVYSATYYDTYNGKRDNGTFYEEPITATYRITETVIDVQSDSLYFAAQLVQKQVVITSSVDLNELDWQDWDERYLNGMDKTKVYWYVIKGSYIYKQDTLDLSKVEDSWLEYIFPLSENNAWYPDREQREMFPDIANGPGSGLRRVSGPISLSLPIGEVQDCFEILTPYLGGGTQSWFCLGVGPVGSGFDHQGTSYGNRRILVDYLLK